MRSAAALCLALLACSRTSEPAHVAAPRPAPAEPAKAAAAVAAAPVAAAPVTDTSWLIGTWERQSPPKEWLLFNAPKEVGVLAGSPPAMINRGEFIPNGPKEISLFLRGAGGGSLERILLVSPDHSELHEKGVPGGTYRRGAPP